MATKSRTMGGGLTLTVPSTHHNMHNKSTKKVVDSWEDDASDDEPSSSVSASMISPLVSANPDKPGLSAPPPTPNSPANFAGQVPWQSNNMLAPSGHYSTDRRGSYGDATIAARRPEKTDAAARRMIASALGVKTPKQTEEQRAYERAMRDQERKRREEERDQERRRAEEADKAKKAVWDE